LDKRIPPQFRDKALSLLVAGGFDRTTRELLAEADVRVVIWTLGGANPQRRKTAGELLTLAYDDDEAA
jgi:hypothetical protein